MDDDVIRTAVDVVAPANSFELSVGLTIIASYLDTTTTLYTH